jgi:branched-chain amino acid transport system permease protein
MKTQLKEMIKMKNRKILLILCFGLIAVLPIFAESYVLHLMILFFVYATIASTWNLTLGYAGIFNWAHTAFFAVGGYASAISCKFFGLSPWLGLWVGGACAVLASLVVGLPTLRLAGLYACLFTFAFWQLTFHIVLYPPITPYTGGSYGIIKLPTFFPYVVGKMGTIPYYYLGFVLLLLSTFILNKTIKSRIGLALVTIRESEEYAVSRGINPYNYKLLAFVISAFFVGMIGSFYAHYLTTIDTRILGWDILWLGLVMVIVGGIETQHGPIIGAFVLIFLSEYTRGWAEYRYIFLGVVMCVTIIFMPSGLAKIASLVNTYFSKAISHVRSEKADEIKKETSK